MKPAFRFGTVGSPLATPKKPGGSVGAVQYLHEIGLSALELGWVRSVRVSESTCREIQAASIDRDVSISVHAPYYINLNANGEEWPKSRQRLIDAAHFGNLAGATDIIFHPGSYFEATPADVLRIAIPRLAECVRELRDQGNFVTLRPETMGKSAMLGSLADTLQMSMEINGVEPCLDFAHLHARVGNGSMNTFDEWMETLKKYKSALGEASLKRLHIHLSGIEYSDKGEKNHLALQESDFNLAALFDALYEMCCGGRILCESPVLEEDAIYLQSVWNKKTAQ